MFSIYAKKMADKQKLEQKIGEALCTRTTKQTVKCETTMIEE